MKKQYKSSIIKNYKITKDFFLWGSSKLFLNLSQKSKKALWEYQVTNDA